MTRFGLSREEGAALKRIMDERNAAFESDDLEWAARQMPGMSAQAVEYGFHMARYECTQVSEQKRMQSQLWLVERKLNSLGGLPVRLGDPLPSGAR